MIKIKKLFSAKKITILLILLLIVCVCISSTKSIDACTQGLVVWASRLLPALFPFFFLTRLFALLGGVDIFEKMLSPTTKFLYNTDGKSGYVFAMSLLSGYPVSAKLIADLYLDGKMTRGQAYRTLTFSSTSGPLFVITTVGIGMFGSAKLGLMVMCVHIVGSMLNGLIYRRYKINDDTRLTQSTSQNTTNILADAMTSSINSILLIGGFVCFFFVIITLLHDYNVFAPLSNVISKAFNANSQIVDSTLHGVVEITKGAIDLSACVTSPKTTLILLSTIVSWGGISINLQSLAFLKKMEFSTSFYFLSKLTQTLTTLLVSFIFCLFI